MVRTERPPCERPAAEEGTVSVASTQSVIEGYFSRMGAEEDFSTFFAEDVTWLTVDTGDEVRGPGPVRDYILALHARMQSGNQRPLVVTDGQVFLEGDAVNAGGDNGSGLAYCLVYDISGDVITALRCYGTLAQLVPRHDTT
jgi:hypothetical protein